MRRRHTPSGPDSESLRSGDSGVRPIVSNTLWLFLDSALRIGLGLVVALVVTRYLGPARFGLLSYAIALASLFGTLATLGLDNILIRDLVREEGAAMEIIGTAFALKLVAGATAVVLAIACAAALNPHDPHALVVVALVSIGTLFASFDTIDIWFRSRVRSKFSVVARNLAFLVATGVRIVLVLSKAPVWAFAAVFSAELALAAAALVVAYRVTGGSLAYWRVSRERARRLLAESWPLAFSALAIIVYMRIDTVMLKELKTASEVGVYAAAVRVSEAWYFIPTAIVSSVFPALVRTHARDPSLYEKRLLDLFSIMTALSVTIALPMTFLSTPLIRTLLGSSFRGAGPVLAIHIWAGIFVAWGVTQSSWYIAEGLLRTVFVRTGVGALINIALNIVLIPAYGAIGCAIATVIAYGCATFVLNAFSARTRILFTAQLQSIAFPVRLFRLARAWR